MHLSRSGTGFSACATLCVRVCLAAACGLLAAAAPAAAPEWIRPDWGAHALWDDGLTEVDVFDATTTLHGKPRPYTMTVLFSGTEVLDNGTEVPPGSSSGGVLDPAIKMTLVSEEIETEAFPYDLATTVLADRRNPARVLSSLATSHDWNGVTAKRFTSVPRPFFQAWSTAGVSGEIRRDLPSAVFPLEAVPLFLRAMDFSTTATFRCLPTLMAHRLPWSGVVPEPTVLDLTAVADGSETTTTAAGTFDCHRVKVTTPEGRVPMVLWIEKAFPNRLIAKTTASGKQFALRSSERRKVAPSDPR